MKKYLTKIMESSVFKCTGIQDNEKKGRIILNNADYPASGLPGREVRVFVGPKSFTKLSTNGAELVFHYELE